MSDKELLELAAKAAGFTGAFVGSGMLINEAGKIWNPLTDDGDALRLAVELRIGVIPTGAVAYAEPCLSIDRLKEFVGNDPYAATRRAIVRAAAEIGKGME